MIVVGTLRLFCRELDASQKLTRLVGLEMVRRGRWRLRHGGEANAGRAACEGPETGAYLLPRLSCMSRPNINLLRALNPLETPT
jgi:hypothetical protein